MAASFLLTHSIILIGCCLGLVLIGYGALNLVRIRPTQHRLLCWYGTGLVLVTTAYAVIQANGATILSINLILLAVGAYLLRPRATLAQPRAGSTVFNIRRNITTALWMLLILALIYWLNLSRLFDPLTGEVRLLVKDLSFYSRMSSYLREFGVENTYVEMFLSDKGGLTPYHYFDLWLGAGISQLTGMHAQFALVLHGYSLMFFGVYLGALSLLRELRSRSGLRRHALDPLLAFSILFITPAGWLYPTHIPILHLDLWALPLTEMPKNALIYLLLFPMLIAAMRQRWMLVSLLACLVAVGHTPAAPVLFLSVATWSLWEVRHGSIDRKVAYSAFAPLILTTVCIVAFYVVLGGPTQVVGQVSDLISYSATPFALKSMMYIIFKTTLQITLTTLPIALLACWTVRQVHQLAGLLILFLSISVFGVITFALLHGIHDSVQFWSMAYMPIASIGVWCVLCLGIILYRKGPPKFLVSLIALLAIVSINASIFKLYTDPTGVNYTPLSSLASGSPRIVFMTDENDYGTVFSKLEDVYVGSTHSIMRQFDPLYITCITNHLIPFGSDQLAHRLQLSTYLRFVSLLKEKGEFSGHNNAHLRFIKQFDIDHLLMSRGRKPPEHLAEHFAQEPEQMLDGYAVYTRSR